MKLVLLRVEIQYAVLMVLLTIQQRELATFLPPLALELMSLVIPTILTGVVISQAHHYLILILILGRFVILAACVMMVAVELFMTVTEMDIAAVRMVLYREFKITTLVVFHTKALEDNLIGNVCVQVDMEALTMLIQKT